MATRRPRKMYAADTENTTGNGETYVYGAGIVDVDSNDEPAIFNDMDSYMDYLLKLPKNSIVYYHNLANYDGHLILYWLLQHGFKKNGNGFKSFDGIITDDGEIYQIAIRYRDNKIKIRDSAKLIGGTLDKIGRDFNCSAHKLIGTIDYDAPRGPGYIMTQTEVEYLKADILVLAEIIRHIRTIGLTDYVTQGSFALAHLKEEMFVDYLKTRGLTDDQINEKKTSKETRKYWKNDVDRHYRNIFPAFMHKKQIVNPDAPKEEWKYVTRCPLDEEIRNAYRGGYCFNNTDSQPINTPGIVLDVNSLYPSCMVDHDYPIGYPVKVITPFNLAGLNGVEMVKYFIDLKKSYPCYFIHFSASFSLKPGKLPFIQLKNNPSFADNEYIRDSDGIRSIWLTSVDFQLFAENYDIGDFQIERCYVFNSARHIFDHFVEKYYEMKKNAKDISTRTMVKIILNSCYGKLGTRILRFQANPEIKDDLIKFNPDYSLFWTHDKDTGNLKETETEYPESTYIPAAAFVTAYGRDKIIRAGQMFMDNLAYIDTDSLHLYGVTVDDVKDKIQIDSKELGLFDHESSFKAARFVRQKCYCEISEDGAINLKAGGLPESGKLQFCETYGAKIELNKKGDKMARIDDPEPLLNAFTFGLELKGVKLMKRRVKGGISLVHADYHIKY